MITISVGQAGCNIGESFWNLIMKEHNIDQDGQKNANLESQQQFNDSLFFHEREKKFTPRALFLDLDADQINQLKKSSLKSVLQENNFISGKEDSSNNYNRAHYTIGKEIIDNCHNQIRKEIEKIDYFQGFQFFHSIVGGTGSGLLTLLQQKLNVDYPKKLKFNYTLLPSKNHNDCSVFSYNSVLALNQLQQCSDLIVYFNNQVMYQMLEERLFINQSSLKDVNNLISQFISLSTSNQRIKKSRSETMQSLTQAAVPFTALKHLIPNYSPLTQSEDYSLYNSQIDLNEEQIIQNYQYQQKSIKNLTYECIQERNSFLPCKYQEKKYICITSFYRGQSINMQDIYSSQQSLVTDENLQFVIKKMKFSNFLSDQIPLIPYKNNFSSHIQRDHGLLINSCAISSVFQKIGQLFDQLYFKRAFVHWFVGEGMSEGEFSESREAINIIENNYSELQEEVEDVE